MPDVPDNAKKPSDRKSKTEESDSAFSFVHDGERHTFKPTFDVLTPGFLRANRRREEVDAFFTMVEALAEADTLAVIDVMDRKSFTALMEDFYNYLAEKNSGN